MLRQPNNETLSVNSSLARGHCHYHTRTILVLDSFIFSYYEIHLQFLFFSDFINKCLKIISSSKATTTTITIGATTSILYFDYILFSF